MREPSLLSNTVGSPASMTATTELVVPRSIPITLAIFLLPPCKEKLVGNSEQCFSPPFLPTLFHFEKYYMSPYNFCQVT